MTKAIKASFVLIFIVVACNYFCSFASANEYPQPQEQYKIIRPIYLMATYNDLNKKHISKETARAYLHSKRYYDKSEVAFQNEVPAGTIMTIIGPAPRVWHLPFLSERYFVQLEPDLSRGLDVVIELNRGIEGNLNGLNPNLFDRQMK